MGFRNKLLIGSACAIVVAAVLALITANPSKPVSPPTAMTRVDDGTRAKVANTGAAASADDTIADEVARESIAKAMHESASGTDDAPEEEGRTVFCARALDAAGAPIEGAAFRLVTAQGRPRPLGVATTSGADGRVEIGLEKQAFFTYAGRDQSNTYLSLGAKGYATHFFVPAAKRGTRKDLGDIVLASGGSISGRVIDASGAPAEGALVVSTASWTGGDLEAARIAGPDREGGRPTTTTDQLGHFTLEGVHVGQALVWAGNEGKLWAVSDVIDVAALATHRGIELVLEELPATSMVAGVVVGPSGAPVPGALIRHTKPGGWGEAKTEADAVGAFLIPTASPMPFTMMAVDVEGELGDSAETWVKAGDIDLRIQLCERRSLRIRIVREAGGEPIENASIISMPPLPRRFFINAKWEHSDADGIAMLPVPGESFRVSVGHTDFDYRQLGPFELDSLPDELLVELTQKPMIHGIVLAGEVPVPGALIELVQECEDGFRPMQNGVPMRVFGGGMEQATADSEGRFSLPVDDDASGVALLLVTKEGYALTEHRLPHVAATTGADGVEVQMNAGGTLAGRVYVGATRSPESVVIFISRGDGKPQLTRPDENGEYRFENLTPGPWRVEDRDAEPEGRVLSVAQGDEHPFRWDCEVRVGEITEYDLDLQWQEGLRVEGTLTFDGKGAAGWTAVLEAPDHSDRPWAARPVTIARDGSFSLAARPGHAKLALRSPLAEPVSMMLLREFEIDRHLEPQVFAFETAAVEGAVAEGASKLRLHHRIDQATHIEARFESSADGRFRVVGFATGHASFQQKVDGGLGWRHRTRLELTAGATCRIE